MSTNFNVDNNSVRNASFKDASPKTESNSLSVGYKLGQASIFNGDRKNGAVVVDHHYAYSTEQFSKIWSDAATKNKTEVDANDLKTKITMISQYADKNGDGYINDDEAIGLDIVGDDGLITEEDIQKIYESLNVTSEEMTDELLNSINDILNGNENKESHKESYDIFAPNITDTSQVINNRVNLRNHNPANNQLPYENNYGTTRGFN